MFPALVVHATGMDVMLFRWVNGLAGQLPLLDAAMVLLADWAVAAAPALLVFLWFAPGPARAERRVEAVLVMLAVLLALGLCDLPGFFYARPRPYEVSRVTLLVNAPSSPSFPSTHVAGTSGMVAALGHRFGAWRQVGWVLTAGMMGARVFVGIHYPADVLAGFLTGWVAGAVVWHNRDALWTFARRIAAVGEELL